MATLRERQKAGRRRDILLTASKLFRREGYEQTHVEEIAKQAGLSTGTIYNYFPTKGDLLLAVVLLDGDASLAEGDKLVADPPADPLSAINRLVEIYIDHALQHLDEKLWCNVMATALSQSHSRFGQSYFDLSRRLTEQMAALFASLNQHGRLRLCVTPAFAGELLFSAMDHYFIQYITNDRRDRDDLIARLGRQNEVLLRGLAQQG